MNAQTVETLAARLRSLNQGAHPLGLSEAAAQTFVREASTGDLTGALRRASRQSRVPDAIDVAKPANAVAVLHDLLPALSRAESRRRQLSAASAYPLALSVVVTLMALVVFAIAGPALSLLAVGTGTRAGVSLAWVAVVASVLMLVLLSGASRGLIPLPYLNRAGALVDRALLLEIAAVFARHGVALDLAFRAAAELVRPPMRAAAARLSTELQAGRMPTGDGGIDAFRAGLLAAAIGRGAGTAALGAIAAESDLEAERWIPHHAARLQIVALLCAGLAVATLAITYYGQYVGVLGGGS